MVAETLISGPIIVEDGSQVIDANSYVSEANLIEYAASRGITLSLPTDQLLLRAMDYLESLFYIGGKLKSTQPLQWPRVDIVIDNFYLYYTNIPKELLRAQYMVAMAIDEGQDPLKDIPRVASNVRVGPISVSYVPGSSAVTLVRRINAMLAKILLQGPTGVSFSVNRG